ncbi:PAS domain-containing protein [Sphingomonas sp. CFBP 8760]
MAEKLIRRMGHLTGSDELTALILSYDWSSTPVGDRSEWPKSLTAILDTMLASRFPMCIGWGNDVTLFYNEAYMPFLGKKHPAALGKPMAAVWSDVWADIEPFIAQAMSGQTVAFDDLPLTMERYGYAEKTWWTFCYSPLCDDDGNISGFLNVASETTSKQHLRSLNATLEQRVAERSEALLLYQDVFQSDPNPACAFDSDYAIVAFNQAFNDEFFRVYGHRAQLGEVFPNLFLPEQGEIIRSYLDRALAGEAFRIIERFGHPDFASPMWEIFYNPLRAADGRMLGSSVPSSTGLISPSR